jgi:hypothetical protein
MIVEKQMECKLAGETEVLGEKTAPASLLSIKKSHMNRLGMSNNIIFVVMYHRHKLFRPYLEEILTTVLDLNFRLVKDHRPCKFLYTVFKIF